MNIGLDYRPALKANSRRRGVGRYTDQLTRALLALDTVHSFTLYVVPGAEVEVTGSWRARPVFHLSKPSRLNWLTDSLALPHRIRSDDLDVFHATDPLVMPAGSSCVVVASIHDLIPYIFWEETRNRVPWDFRFALKRAWRRMRDADLVVTHSEHSRRDICRMLSLPLSRVHVVPPGCTLEPVPFSVDQAEAIRRRRGINESFLLYVGGSDYRKNLPKLFEAFRGICRHGYRGQLVMVGETFTWDIPEVRELKRVAMELDVAGSVQYLGFVDDAELSILYGTCDFFLFPSLYEGFGLPVLEAMKCGAPLLISHASSIPEVAGDAAFYFDPESADAMVESFIRAAREKDLREQNRERARQIASRFSWKSTAERMIDLYETGARARREM